jgi:hypothetical protein
MQHFLQESVTIDYKVQHNLFFVYLEVDLQSRVKTDDKR